MESMESVEHEPRQPDLTLFMASAAHDMKNSVCMLSGNLEAILADPATRHSPAFDQLAHMLYETRRLNNNLIQLLAIYKELGSAAYPFDPQMQSLSDFAADIAAQHQLLFDACGLNFSISCPEDLVWCFDEYLVFGVISHAINNAIRYSRGHIHLAISECADHLEMRVEDDGDGYPDSMQQLCQPGCRAVDFASGSTGLGLFFASQVARMHKHRGHTGQIVLNNESRVGGGCFILRLP